MATYELRPLAVGELLDATFGIYRRHFGTLLGIGVVCHGPAAVILLYAGLAGGWMQHLWLALEYAVLAFIGGLLGAGATLHAISEAYLGREPAVGQSLLFAIGKIWALFVAGLARGLVVALACVLLIVPGVIVACGYAVTSQVVVFEELAAPTDALKRSWTLTKGFKGKVFVLAVVVFLLLAVPGAAISMLGGAGSPAGELLSSIVSLVLNPILACAFTLLYYDLRVRKEAFDLELLGRQLGLEASGA
jgi:hypothetical protein